MISVRLTPPWRQPRGSTMAEWLTDWLAISRNARLGPLCSLYSNKNNIMKPYFIFLCFPLVRTTSGTSWIAWRYWHKTFPLFSTSRIDLNTHLCSCEVTRSTESTTNDLKLPDRVLWFTHRRQVAHDHILTAISILSDHQNGHPTVNVPTSSHLLCNLATSSACKTLTSSPCAAT